MRFKLYNIDVQVNGLIIPLVLLVFLLGQMVDYLIIFLCAFIHEMAHIAVARLYGLKIDSVGILPVGFVGRIKKYSVLPLHKEIMLYSSGPAANLILAMAAACYSRQYPNMNNMLIEDLVSLNTILALINLVPVLPLDGGRIAAAVLSLKVGFIKLFRAYGNISKVVCATMLMPSFLVCIFTGNFSYFVVCVYIFFIIYKNSDILKAEPVVELINKKKELSKSLIIRSELIVVDKSVYLVDLINQFTLYKFYLVAVKDERTEIIGIIGETDILEYLIENSTFAKVGDLLLKKKA